MAWCVAPAETGELAESLIAEALTVQGIEKHQLALHADRGTSMTSKPVAQLLVDLGVARSHSRPHASSLLARKLRAVRTVGPGRVEGDAWCHGWR